MKVKILFIILFIIILYESVDKVYHDIIIDNIFKNQINYNFQEYIGYIEIERVKIKREIVYGINDLNLLNHVALESKCKSLECESIILAGHSIDNIFKKLHDIKIKDEIKIGTAGKVIYYSVINIEIVRKDDLDVLNTGDLILITCMANPNYRLIVKANKK